MEIDILAVPKEIDFAPDNEVKEIIQNVRTICTTPKYSVPMDRAFGVDIKMLDRPTPKAMAALQAELTQTIRKYEPRCKVKRIFFEGNKDGRLNFKVRIIVNEI